MLDTIIRGGTIVDGTGGEPWSGDVGIEHGRIVELGKVGSPARQVIDAAGAIVAPGFIDVHTHYDGQLIWDSRMDPSFSNGVTTIVAGNCGVGFAPVRHELRQELVSLMEGVEDIPGIVLDEGLDWRWDSFPDFLDRIAARHYALDVACYLPQAPLRVFVMGERALRHQSATDGDIELMSAITAEAVEAGAVGISISRIREHRSAKNDYVPGTFADEQELLALARALGSTGKGILQIAPLGAAGDFLGARTTFEQKAAEHELYVKLSRAAGRPLNYFVHQMPHAPSEWRQMLALTAEARREGVPIAVQVSCRAASVLMTLDGYHPFMARPSYRAIEHLPLAERAAAMREAERRRAILGERGVWPPDLNEFSRRMQQMMEALFASYHILRRPIDYEPDDTTLFEKLAKAKGLPAEEVCYDYLVEGDGTNVAASYTSNYVDGNLDPVFDMLQDPNTLTGLGDGGAHLQMICDASLPTSQLTLWGRDRTRGPRLPLELLVHKLTAKPAELLGFGDRGTLECGKRADLNVIDFSRLACGYPRMCSDLPKGGKRLLQPATGYVATMVDGVVTRSDDEPTGALPGRLVRSARAS